MEESKKSVKQGKKEEKRQQRQQNRKAENRAVTARNFQEKQAAKYDAEGNVVTNYDKKMQKRREKERKEKRNGIITRVILVLVLIAVAAGLSIVAALRLEKRYGTAVTVNGQEVGRVEFDYYYGMAVNNFLGTYGNYASYIGLDTSKDFSKQTYDGDKTWEDYFAGNAVDMIKRIKALSDDADKNSFEYDVSEDYNEFTESVKTGADEDSVSIDDYYKSAFGQYATAKNIEPYVKKYLRANAYYEDVTDKITFTDEQKDSYYNEHKDDYDLVDYRYLKVDSADKANAMLEAVKDEETYRKLCEEYASDEQKSEYQSSDKSLNTGSTKSKTAAGSEVAAWLFGEGRKEGDKTVISSASDTTANYVVYFIKRYSSDTQRTAMVEDMTNDKAADYLDSLIENMEVKDGTVKVK